MAGPTVSEELQDQLARQTIGSRLVVMRINMGTISVPFLLGKCGTTLSLVLFEHIPRIRSNDRTSGGCHGTSDSFLATQTSRVMVLERIYCPWCARATNFGAAFDEHFYGKRVRVLPFWDPFSKKMGRLYTHEGDVSEEWQLGARCSGTLTLPRTRRMSQPQSKCACLHINGRFSGRS